MSAVPEQRLHPLSWLFELFNVLRQFIVPIIILLFTGQGDRYELWGLLGVGVMVPLAVARYYSFRYRIGGDRIVIRSGLFHKTVRDIAFTRIQNVTLHQGLLHRLMGVAEVRLETGGGEDKEEGRMRVLGFAEAQALQRIIRSSELPAGTPDAEAPASDEQVLLQLPTRELLKLGLISNKGMLLVAAAIGGAYQFNWKLPQAVFEHVGGWLMNHRDDLGSGPGAYVLGGMLVLLAAFTLLRLISILQALLHYYGFTLSSDAHRLSITRGLLNRFNGSLPRTRIQAWTLEQGWLQRRFKRYALRVDAAAGSQKHEQLESHWALAPISDDAGIAHIIGTVLPAGSWPVAEWLPLHPNAWQRRFKMPALLLLTVTAICVSGFGAFGLLPLLGIPWLYVQSKIWARHAGYAHANGLIAVREGWIGKHWRFAQTRKVQAVYLRQSPFDRRHGMATVFCDTVNAGMGEPALAVRYLPFDEAVRLHDELAAAIAQ
ncbi:MAG: PH domain-containing protein [Arenimonas sp.]|uniref:PH domain-containing protein n=1 Tax=Arenimonas sp. TaxID=1872635 RepID=UPI003C0FCEA9